MDLTQNERIALAVAFGLIVASVVLIWLAVVLLAQTPSLPPLPVQGGIIPA